MITKIISGGQTGADRAGLDWAMKRGVAVGGWCPKGRLAEDGPIPASYPLVEAASADYLVRTRLNVRDSDGTLIVTSTSSLSRGSLRTRNFATDLGRPYLHIQMSADPIVAAQAVAHFCNIHRIRVLNVAGTRAAKAPGIAAFVIQLLDAAFPEVESDSPNS